MKIKTINKKSIISLLVALFGILPAMANEPDRLNVNVGIQVPYTLDATIGWERTVGSGHALEVFAEAGNHWQTPVCHMFWKKYYWDGGVAYKHKIKHFKNGSLRLVGGGYVGADRGRCFFGFQAGFEYNYVFPNEWVFTVSQKNNFNFLHGDSFRNGITLGVKIPF